MSNSVVVDKIVNVCYYVMSGSSGIVGMVGMSGVLGVPEMSGMLGMSEETDRHLKHTSSKMNALKNNKIKNKM